MYKPLPKDSPESACIRNMDMENGQLSQGLVGDGSVDRRGRIALKAKTGGWKAAPLIFGTEICERMASLGLQRNLVTYFVNKMNLSKVTSANMVSNFVGTLYLTPFLGGFMADAYMGRFWAISAFATIQVLGMVLLTLSASLKSLRPPTCASSASTCIAAHGASLYRYKLPSGSPLTRIAQVVVAALRKRKLALPSDKDTLFEEEIDGGEHTLTKNLPHSNQFIFLDKAAVMSGEERKDVNSRWYLCTVTQVEEVKILLRMLPIWASTAFVWTALTQMETFSVLEGATLDGRIGRSFHFPPASLSVFELVNVLLILPLYDRFFVPTMRKVTGHERGITTLQRIGTGIVFSMLAMVVAGFVELKRIQTAKDNGLLDLPNVTVPMSIFWLVPQYFFRGSTEIFTQIGQLEFFYNEVPDSMRSLGTALYLSTIAVGHFLSTVLVTVINEATGHGGKEKWILNNLNRSKLYYFYWLLAGLSFINFLIYLVCAHWYRYKPSAKRVEILEQEGVP